MKSIFADIGEFSHSVVYSSELEKEYFKILNKRKKEK